MPTNSIEQIDLKPNVLGDQVSRILSDAILEGVLKGGDKLVEAEFQKKFGISRSPLREAFRDLEKKGLVVIIPRKGTFVRSITRKDIEDNFPVRSALEGLAAREAHGKMTLKDKKKMAQALKGMEKSVGGRDIKLYWKYHLQFHDIFIHACQNDVLISILQTLRVHSMWYRFSYQYYQEDLEKSLDVHQRICDRFHDDATDVTKLDRLVRHHIEVAVERFLAYLEREDALPT
jgi:DNA-binding GntR family transcriptional regulator